jgi:hypothetical protein
MLDPPGPLPRRLPKLRSCESGSSSVSWEDMFLGGGVMLLVYNSSQTGRTGLVDLRVGMDIMDVGGGLNLPAATAPL